MNVYGANGSRQSKFLLEVKRWVVRGLKLAGAAVSAFVLLLSPVLVGWVAKRLGADFDTGLRAAGMVYSWPVVSGISIIVAIVLFRTSLRGLIDRIRSVKGGPIELHAGAGPREGEEERRSLIAKIDKWSESASNRKRLSAWVRPRRRGSLTFILYSATVPELEEIIEKFEIA